MTLASTTSSDATAGSVPISSWAPALIGRSITRLTRKPDTMIFTAIFPLLLLLTMLAVFSTAVAQFEGDDYAQRLVPGLVVSGILFGSIGTAVGFWVDLDTGFMQRIRTLPLPSLSPVVGVLTAETVRASAAVVVLVSVGTAFGFRFDNGVVSAVGFVVVALLIPLAVVWPGLSIAASAESQEAVGPPLNAFFLVLLFFSEGLVPLDAYPGWAQPLVEWNPATAYVRLLDGLARGGALLEPALIALAWSVVLVIVFGWLTFRRLNDVD